MCVVDGYSASLYHSLSLSLSVNLPPYKAWATSKAEPHRHTDHSIMLSV